MTQQQQQEARFWRVTELARQYGSMRKAAKALGVSQGYLSALRSGAKLPRFSRAANVRGRLGL